MSSEGRLVRPKLRFERDFTQLPNSWLRDPRLTFKARGLLGELMTHDAGWYVTIKSLAATSPDGRAAIQTAVQELQDAGYLRREQTRTSRGQLGHVWWELLDPFEEKLSTGKTEKPRSEPLADFPSTDKPSTDKPSAENRPTKEERIKEQLTKELNNATTDARGDKEDALPGGSHSPAAASAEFYAALLASKCRASRTGRHTPEGSGYCRDCGARVVAAEAVAEP